MADKDFSVYSIQKSIDVNSLEQLSVFWNRAMVLAHTCFNFKSDKETVSYEIPFWKSPVLRAVKPSDHIRDPWRTTFTQRHQRPEETADDLTGIVIG